MFDFLFPKKLHRHISAYFEAVEVDIHSHLLPAIDDGSPNLDVSMQLIRQMCELGFKKIITTPHISELYPNNGDSVLVADSPCTNHLKPNRRCSDTVPKYGVL